MNRSNGKLSDPNLDLNPRAARSLNIFINFAPGLFTNRESNGEGLIVYALAAGLANRGHHVHVLAGKISIDGALPPTLHVAETGPHRIPFNSLAPSEYMARADRHLRQLMRGETVDLVWRIYGGVTPRPPRTFGLPLVLGPIQYEWPRENGESVSGRPRLGIGLGSLAERLYASGTLAARARADLLLYETEPHAESRRAAYPRALSASIPLIARVPDDVKIITGRTLREGGRRDAVRLLFAANLYPNKRCEVFCRTVGLLRSQYKIDAVGIVLGDGPQREMLESLCEALPEIGKAVEFRGRVPNDAVYAAVGDADFFVSTSVGEPYGRSIVEAMAMGTPPVCHRSGGPGDYIRNGETGLLIETIRPEDYAAGIAALCADPARWAAISARASEQARSEWTSDAVLERLEGLFGHLIK